MRKRRRNKHIPGEYLISIGVAVISSVLVVLLVLALRLPEEPFLIEFRDDVEVVIAKDVLLSLNNAYLTSNKELLYCLMGEKKGDTITISALVNPEIRHDSAVEIIAMQDPACQMEGSLGSLHTHPKTDCEPSRDDIFSWGEMKNPEPLINAIQCGVNKFYIPLMPGKHESFDFRSLRWRAE